MVTRKKALHSIHSKLPDMQTPLKSYFVDHFVYRCALYFIIIIFNIRLV